MGDAVAAEMVAEMLDAGVPAAVDPAAPAKGGRCCECHHSAKCQNRSCVCFRNDSLCINCSCKKCTRRQKAAQKSGSAAVSVDDELVANDDDPSAKRARVEGGVVRACERRCVCSCCETVLQLWSWCRV